MFKAIALSSGIAVALTFPAIAQFPRQSDRLQLVYPPNNHQTSAAQIFLIGSAPAAGTVAINGEPITRSDLGHFAPSLPLAVGQNQITLTYRQPSGQTETKTLTVERLANNTIPPNQLEAPFPAVDIARQADETICFQVQGPAQAQVRVALGGKSFPLQPQTTVTLPSNAAVLTLENEAPAEVFTGTYGGCQHFTQGGNLGQARYQMNVQGQTSTATSPGRVEILDAQNTEAIAVISLAGVARTGPSTNFSRLTPLPQGTQALVTGKEGDWLRLDYGAWIRASETTPIQGAVPPTTLIRSLRSQTTATATNVIFPLQRPVPVTVSQNDDTFSLTLHQAIAQTDTIYLDESPIIRRLDWAQIDPETIRYDFRLKTDQQWGHSLRYEGSNLILSLRHPPQLQGNSLRGATIWLDPGHGGAESGALGPTGYPEKAINLLISQKIQKQLEAKGAEVILSRTTDQDLSLGDRQAAIRELQPTLALSVHYNALPDAGDAENTAGIGMFWYHPQAHDLAQFLHDDLTTQLGRPSYGVFWNNLALTRPQEAPAVLMELGFMINPTEFEWITDPQAQEELAGAIAKAIETWLQTKAIAQ
ncbi:N-acetylmuramoyl-L-alanine amidase [Picosynechococcus sp. PCC 73109]|uniref:N-acetylmuramoyl-L-alanine amidase n=1 Tax=Picosynechococcus sp. PCC 73109 TaxID=374982 RepID=UPI000745962E|nr:N-acetylmuramoyl-L-alanine amidase [Picosynechococcus sp. PCC 73109]AMA08383.1 N-acetylmuramoyl-L-alanine amidase [Picosynechococcus sp. PCC 73109]